MSADITIRPIGPEDEPLLVKFHETLSDLSVYLRYFHWLKLEQRTEHERLARICSIAIITGTWRWSPNAGPRTRASGRFLQWAGWRSPASRRKPNSRRLWATVSKSTGLVDFARGEKIERITAAVLFENRPMQKVFQRLGFRLKQATEGEALQAELVLGPGAG